MSIKETHTQFDALLKEQMSQLNPEVPEGVWEGMEAQLDQLNQGLQFDSSIRDSVNQINVPAPQGVFEAVQTQLASSAAGISGGLSLATKWFVGSLLTGAVALSAYLLLPNQKAVLTETLIETVQEHAISADEITPKQSSGINNHASDDMPVSSIIDNAEVRASGTSNGPKKAKTTLSSQGNITPGILGDNPNKIPVNGGDEPLINSGNLVQDQMGNSLVPVFAFSQKDTMICWGLSYETYLLYGDNCTYDVSVNGIQVQKGIHGNQNFKYQAEGPGVYLIDWIVRANEHVWKKSQILYVQALPEIKLSKTDRGNGRYILVNEGIDKTVWSLDGQRISNSDIQLYDAQPTDHLVQAIAINNAGCKDSAKLSFRNNFIFDVKELNFPNSFTPNGDGKNDYFQVEVEGATYFHIRILNYESQIVFESTDPQAKWDGADKYKGNKVLQGTFTCIVEYALAGGDIKKEMKVIYLLKD